jgi:hypothetical protein
VKPPVSVPPPPLKFVTVTSRAPGVAPLAIVNVAVSWVADPAIALLRVTPAPLALTVAPATNPDPMIVTGTAVPGVPRFGDTELTVTAAPATANVAVTVADTFPTSVQGAVPPQPPPDQPLKVELDEGVAVRATTFPDR